MSFTGLRKNKSEPFHSSLNKIFIKTFYCISEFVDIYDKITPM